MSQQPFAHPIVPKAVSARTELVTRDGYRLTSDDRLDIMQLPAMFEWRKIMAGKLADQVAIITGASSGIGEATALALASVGAFIGDRGLAGRSTRSLESAHSE